MKPILEHTLIVLEQTDDWMKPWDLTLEVQRVFPKANIQPVFRKLQNTANVGHDSKLGYRWYPWRDGVDDLTQKNLDAGDNW